MTSFWSDGRRDSDSGKLSQLDGDELLELEDELLLLDEEESFFLRMFYLKKCIVFLALVI